MKKVYFQQTQKTFCTKKWSKKPPSGQKIKKFQFCFSESKYGLSWPRSQNLRRKNKGTLLSPTLRFWSVDRNIVIF